MRFSECSFSCVHLTYRCPYARLLIILVKCLETVFYCLHKLVIIFNFFFFWGGAVIVIVDIVNLHSRLEKSSFLKTHLTKGEQIAYTEH